MTQSVSDLVAAPLRLDAPDGGAESLRSACRSASTLGVSAFVLFGGDRRTFPRVRSGLERAAGRPLLLLSDLERGCGQQVAGMTELPCAMAIGATASADLAERCGRLTAREASALGIQVILAPVLDVNVNARNPIINTRSFGGDPEEVARLGAAFSSGVRQGGAAATAKHFPGHGDTSRDSHLETAVLEGDAPALRAVHLRPFEAAVRTGVDAVMVGHLAAPALDGGRTRPATVSEGIVQGWLRGRLEFEGVAMTDALLMGGVATRGAGPGAEAAAEAAVAAIAAGCDLALYPPDTPAAIEALERAVREGRLRPARVEQARARLAALRSRLADRRAPRGPEERDLAREAAEAAITRVADPRGLLPLSSREGANLELVLVEDSARCRPAPFESAMKRRFAGLRVARVPGRDVATLEPPSRVRIVAGFGSPRAFRPEIPPIPARESAAHVLVSLGSPYLFGLSAPSEAALVCAYGDAPCLAEAAAAAIAGEIPFRGRLPVSMPGAS